MGLEAFEIGAEALATTPIADLMPIGTTAARNRHHAEKALACGLDPNGSLWISYTEHLAAVRSHRTCTSRTSSVPQPALQRQLLIRNEKTLL